MGFHIIVAKGGAKFGNPVGLDGVFESTCPAYHPTMDAAVDALLAPRSPGGKETGAVPHRMSEAEHRAGTIRINAEGLACTKAICNYIHDTLLADTADPFVGASRLVACLPPLSALEAARVDVIAPTKKGDGKGRSSPPATINE